MFWLGREEKRCGAMDDEEEAKLSEMQKIEMAKWFLVNSPPGEIQYVAKGTILPMLARLVCLINRNFDDINFMMQTLDRY